MNYTIDFDKSTVGYGSLSVNETNDYNAVLDDAQGDAIFAHASSVVYIDVITPLVVQGKLSRDAFPLGPCRFLIDGVEIGSLWNPFDSTAATSIAPGRRRLEVYAKNPGNAHAYWFIAGVRDGTDVDLFESQPVRRRGRKRKEHYEK